MLKGRVASILEKVDLIDLSLHLVDLLTLTGVETQDLLSRQIITSAEIVSKYLDQIEKHNHAGINLNAIISTAPKESVLEHAKQLDKERQSGKVRGPFHGVPILLKVSIRARRIKHVSNQRNLGRILYSWPWHAYNLWLLRICRREG